MKRAFVAIRAIIYASVFVWIWYWVAVQVMPLDEAYGLALPAWLQPIGLVVGIVGGLVALWCITEFVRRGRGTPAPFDAPREFVASGPYRYVRNPMYLGGLAGIMGAALYLRSTAMLGVAALFVVLMHLFVLVYEEPTLERRFGESYRRYKERVRRWVPGRNRE